MKVLRHSLVAAVACRACSEHGAERRPAAAAVLHLTTLHPRDDTPAATRPTTAASGSSLSSSAPSSLLLTG